MLMFKSLSVYLFTTWRKSRIPRRVLETHDEPLSLSFTFILVFIQYDFCFCSKSRFRVSLPSSSCITTFFLILRYSVAQENKYTLSSVPFLKIILSPSSPTYSSFYAIEWLQWS
jgi:hypothetical protein